MILYNDDIQMLTDVSEYDSMDDYIAEHSGAWRSSGQVRGLTRDVAALLLYA